jgi:hypothetical protein
MKKYHHHYCYFYGYVLGDEDLESALLVDGIVSFSGESKLIETKTSLFGSITVVEESSECAIIVCLGPLTGSLRLLI